MTSPCCSCSWCCWDSPPMSSYGKLAMVDEMNRYRTDRTYSGASVRTIPWLFCCEMNRLEAENKYLSHKSWYMHLWESSEPDLVALADRVLTVKMHEVSTSINSNQMSCFYVIVCTGLKSYQYYIIYHIIMQRGLVASDVGNSWEYCARRMTLVWGQDVSSCE